nr:uncharacterized protein LOC129267362 [Lytechinus pictus]
MRRRREGGKRDNGVGEDGETPAWNYGPNEDKHWIIRQASSMTKVERDFTDALQRKRLITLLSVDDAIEKLYTARELELLGELDNTYILMTSDHGYHLGQFNMLKGKSNAYDTDIRVPFYIRGPDVPHGIRVPNIVLNIDLAPTMLDMAGVNIPPHMDGTSIMKLFKPISNYKIARKSKKWKYIGNEPWRESFLVEKTRSPEEMGRYMERVNRPTKSELLKQECENPDLQPPCKWGQSKVCVEDPDGSLHLRKCRAKSKKKCVCTPPPVVTGGFKDMSKTERRQQRKILKLQSNSNKGGSKSRSSVRGKRDTPAEDEEDDINNEVIDNAGLETMCEILQNETIICDNEVFSSRQAWKEHRKSVENQLRYLRRYMDKLKEIKTFLKNYRPEKELLDTFPGDKTAFSIELSEEQDFLTDGGEDIPRGQSTATPPQERTVSSSVLRNFENIGQNTVSDTQREDVEADGEQRGTGPDKNKDRTREEDPNGGRPNGKKEPATDPEVGVLGEECTCKDVEVLEVEDQDLEIEIPMIDQEDIVDPEDDDDDDDGSKGGEDNVEDYIESPLLQMQSIKFCSFYERDDRNQVLDHSKVCVEDPDGSLHLRKCRAKSKKKCVCTPPPVVTGGFKDMSKTERRQQRKILKLQSNSNKGGSKSRSSVRGKRDTPAEDEEDDINNEVIDNAGLETMCEILQNETIICDNEVFSSRQAWKEHRKSVENQLRYLRRYMDKLKEIKTFLKNYRPEKELLDTFPGEKTAFSIELSEEQDFLTDGGEDIPRGQSTATPPQERTVSSSVLRNFENIGQNTVSDTQREDVEADGEQRGTGPDKNKDRTREEDPNGGRPNGKKEPATDPEVGVLGEECTCKDVEVLEWRRIRI